MRAMWMESGGGSRRVAMSCLATVALGVGVGAAAAQDLSDALESSYPTNLNMLTAAADDAVGELFLNFTLPEGVSVLLESETDHEGQWFVQSMLLNRLTRGGYTVFLRDQEPAVRNSGNAGVEDGAPIPLREERRRQREAAKAQEEVESPEGSADAAEGTGETEEPGDSSSETGADISAEPSLDPTPVTQPERKQHPRTDYVLRFRVAECSIRYPNSYRKSPLGSRTVQRLASVSLFATLLHGEREDVAWVGRGDAERLDLVPAGKLSLLEGNTFPFSKPVLNTKGLGSYVEPALVTGIVAGLIYLFYTNQN